VAYSYDGNRLLTGSEDFYAREFETLNYNVVASGKFTENVNYVGYKPLTYAPVVCDWNYNLNLPNLDLSPNLVFKDGGLDWFARWNPAGTLILGGNSLGELFIAKPEAAPVVVPPPAPIVPGKKGHR
jgi:hypothetical protein